MSLAWQEEGWATPVCVMNNRLFAERPAQPCIPARLHGFTHKNVCNFPGNAARGKYSFKFQSKAGATGATQRFSRKLANGRTVYARRRAPTMAGQVCGMVVALLCTPTVWHYLSFVQFSAWHTHTLQMHAPAHP